MKFLVSIRRKEGLADPEGVETARALSDLGYSDVTEVRFGRTITVEFAEGTSTLATITEMCERLLANPVIEEFTIEAVE
jgi:phosphoribosylformylglycinamidine synthase PurS subunit